MPTGTQPFKEIALDFVGELLESEGYNAILVITDWFTKTQYYIPARTTWTSEDMANAYICHIWKHYGLPKHITSDRGPQFASEFWKEINQKLGIILHLSTTHHPQTDGLSEHVIQTLKQYLRIYYHDRQNRWAAWLALAEFAYNSSTASSYRLSPFYNIYGFEPKTIYLSDNELNSLATEEWLDQMTTVHSQIQSTLKKINDWCSELRLEKSRQFKVGDQVLIDRRNLTVKAENNQSLTQKWIGSYTIIKAAGCYAYKLELPKSIRLHPIIYTTMVKPFKLRAGDEMEVDDE